MHPARAPRSPGPSRQPHSPPPRTVLPPPPVHSPPPSQPPHPHHAQHTSLPPIRQLYLPHPQPAGPPPLPPPNLPPPYPYPYQPPQHIVPGHPREADMYGTADSEPEDLGDIPGPPKKKRRRQALSCTECKRRKIKCDRSQPCAPCTRRGEQAKCQWHVVEPIEKYVTRAEYDELKARFEHLSALVDRLLQAPVVAAALGATPEAVSAYAGVSPPSQPHPLHHHPLMPPPQNYPQQHGESSGAQALPPPPHRYAKGEEVASIVRPPGSSHGVGSSPSPGLASARPPMNKSPTSAAAIPKSSPLSLAAITSPFTPTDHAAQSKNCHAQTFTLGERLRPGSQVLGDPVTRTPRFHRQYTPRKDTPMRGTHPSICIHLRRASVGSAI